MAREQSRDHCTCHPQRGPDDSDNGNAPTVNGVAGADRTPQTNLAVSSAWWLRGGLFRMDMRFAVWGDLAAVLSGRKEGAAIAMFMALCGFMTA